MKDPKRGEHGKRKVWPRSVALVRYGYVSARVKVIREMWKVNVMCLFVFSLPESSVDAIVNSCNIGRRAHFRFTGFGDHFRRRFNSK